ncbi:hypothetical protein [Acinetobacter bereziniae]|uniref:hypothetical protein n=1 Tax=Acinetobacter bereziniae TaxID=106648 RepID=UPI0011176ED5|nr:hypothetical protein [Acinetobacter bereziniae]QQC79469.1 hypothetical protein I9192_16040 [Acinetobacter bereziniae]TNL51221.1 hypothetical protein EYB59_08855 [Acinetobacter bereziniae]TNL58465.1 hypothetical protein EYY58_11680 [Acinetobacter bereziniae]UUN92546.1 hypothetical protein I9189_015905 [Acinetobacter bereziniae]
MDQNTNISQVDLKQQTHYDALNSLISHSDISYFAAIIGINLSEASVIFDEIDDKELAKNTRYSLLNLSIDHAYSISVILEKALTIHSFAEFYRALKMVQDLINTLKLAQNSTLSEKNISTYLYGLSASSRNLEGVLDSLTGVIFQNREMLNV